MLISKNIDSKWVLKRSEPVTWDTAGVHFQKHRLKVSTETARWLGEARQCCKFPKTSTQSEYWNYFVEVKSEKEEVFPKTSTQSEYWNQNRYTQWLQLWNISKNIDSKWVLKRMDLLTCKFARVNFQKHRLKVSTETRVFQRITHAGFWISKNIDSKWVLKRVLCGCAVLPACGFPKTSTQSEYWNAIMRTQLQYRYLHFQKHRLKVSTETSPDWIVLPFPFLFPKTSTQSEYWNLLHWKHCTKSP